MAPSADLQTRDSPLTTPPTRVLSVATGTAFANRKHTYLQDSATTPQEGNVAPNLTPGRFLGQTVAQYHDIHATRVLSVATGTALAHRNRMRQQDRATDRTIATKPQKPPQGGF